MKIAVIILNYNSSADCTQCISFLKRQEDADLDIVIVDNGSHAEDVAHLRALCETEGCVFLPCTQNRGYSAGNNTGLRYAADKGYRYALITNPDMEFPQTDYISKLVGWMDTDRRIAVAGTDITGPDGLHQNPMKPEGNWRNSFDWIKTLFRKKKTDAYRFIDNHQTSHYCHKLGGCCMMVNLAFIRESDILTNILSCTVKRPFFQSRWNGRAGGCITRQRAGLYTGISIKTRVILPGDSGNGGVHGSILSNDTVMIAGSESRLPSSRCESI